MESLYGVPSTVLSRTTYIFNNEDFSDVVLNVGGQQYRGHKLLLSLASPVFASTIKGFVSNDAIVSLNIPNTDPAIFYTVLKYIYTDDIDLHTVTEACRVLTLSENYQIFSLQQKCHEYINRHFIPPERAIKMFETASTDKLKMDGVRELCMYTFSKATKAIFESASFCEAQLSTVEVIAKMNDLTIDCEMDILLAIMEWGKAYCQMKDLPVDTSLRANIEPLLKHIRFLTIPLPDLKEFWKTYNNLMTSEEVCALTISSLNPDFGTELPKSLCSLNNCRSVPISHEMENEKICNTDCNPQPCNSTVGDALKQTAVKELNSNSSPQEVDSVKSKNIPTNLSVENSTSAIMIPLRECTSLAAKKSISHFEYRSVTKKCTEAAIGENLESSMENFSSKALLPSPTCSIQFNNFLQNPASTTITNITQNIDVNSKIFRGTRTVVSPQKLESDSESDEDNNSSTESDTEEEVYENIKFQLDNQKEIPQGMQPADVKSIINFSVFEGFVKIIGVKMHMRYVTAKETRNIHTWLEVDGKMKHEQVDTKVILSSPFDIFFKTPLHVHPNNIVRIVVTVEDVQLRCCSMCVFPIFNGRDKMGNPYRIVISGSHFYASHVYILISGILYRNH